MVSAWFASEVTLLPFPYLRVRVLLACGVSGVCGLCWRSRLPFMVRHGLGFVDCILWLLVGPGTCCFLEPWLAAGLRWLGFILGCPPSVASLWRVLTWFFVRYLLACPHDAAVPLDYWVRWCSYSSCLVTYLSSGRCSSSVHDRDVAFPTLVGFAFHLRAVLLPQADAVGFGLCWSARLSDLLTGRCCSFTLDSSSLAWLKGEPSTVFLLLCLPSGCGHPLGSLVSSVTIDRQRRFPLEVFFFCVVASRLVLRS